MREWGERPRTFLHTCEFVLRSVVPPGWPKLARSSCRGRGRMAVCPALRCRGSRCCCRSVAVDRWLARLNALCDLAILGGHLQNSLSLLLARRIHAAVTPQQTFSTSRLIFAYSLIKNRSDTTQLKTQVQTLKTVNNSL